jgi:hypothetical protein
VRYIRLVATFIPLLWFAVLHAQTPPEQPDLSGIWTIDGAKTQAVNPPPSHGAAKSAPAGLNTDAVKPGTGRLEAPGQSTMSSGETFTLRQTDTTLVRESQGPSGTLSATYTFDSSHAVEVNGLHPGNAEVEAHWTNGTLVVTTTHDRGNARIASTTVYTRDGAWLTVTTTQPAASDRNGRVTPARTQTVYYKAVGR